METKEQKIKDLKKEINITKQMCKRYKHRFGAKGIRQELKVLKQELKELENDTRN